MYMVWKIKFSLENIKKECFIIPELSKHKWKHVSGGKFGIMYVSENGKLIVKIQRVMEIKGLQKDGFEDGFYPVPVFLEKTPTGDELYPEAGAYSEVVAEAKITKKMGELGISPKVISYGFCPNKKYFYVLMEKKGMSFKMLCDRDKRLQKSTYIHRVNFNQVKEKIKILVDEGWIHHDLHSGNILLSDPPENEFFIIDFGDLRKHNEENPKILNKLYDNLYKNICYYLRVCDPLHGRKCMQYKSKIKKVKPKIKKVKKSKKLQKPKIKKVKKSKKVVKKSKKKIIKDHREGRPSPAVSATLFPVGTIKNGGDGNMWEVVENKNGVKRWKRV